MELIKDTTPDKRIDYSHDVLFKGKKYTREETVMPQSFRWESTPKGELENFHTIRWKSFDEEEYQMNGPIEYFNLESGWANEEGRLDKSNPVPEIEVEFKKTFGKDLIYF